MKRCLPFTHRWQTWNDHIGVMIYRRYRVCVNCGKEARAK